MATWDIIIGQQGCPITKVVSLLKSSPSFHLFIEKWTDIALDLETPTVLIKELRRNYLLAIFTLTDTLCALLEEWVTRKSREATLSVLVRILNNNGLKDCAEALKNGIRTNDNPAGTVKLFKDTIPKDLSYYVDRRLLSRYFLSPTAIFQVTSQDIFLFIGIEHHKLSNLAGSKMTYSSGDQLRCGSITGQYMLLETSLHFDRICSKTQQHVHLLRYGDGKLRWIKSRGQMGVIQGCVCPDESQIELTEEEFCRSLGSSSDRAICISDSPGMGKSVLLANIGRRLKKSCPDRLIFFLAITEFIDHIKNIGGSGREPTPKYVESALKKLLCKNSSAEEVLKCKLNAKSEEGPPLIELLLDGFDELGSTDFKVAHEMLQTIRMSFKSVRLWVTSRPHLLHELEDKLNLLGFNIQPFSDVDQVQFLTSFWLQDKASIDVKRIRQFASHCLKSLNNKMNSKDRDIAGNPLQCLLIGEVYKEDAWGYVKADTWSSTPFSIGIDSITNLYLRFIDKKLDKYITSYRISNFDKQSIMDMHVNLSLQTIFPKYYSNLKHLFPPIQMDEILKIGIVESTGPVGSHRFIHRTLAEFSISWYIMDRMRSGKGWGEELTDFVFRNILRTKNYLTGFDYIELLTDVYFKYPVITFFMDSIIADHNDFKETEVIRIHFIMDEFHKKMIDEIAYACSRDDLVHIFKFLERGNAFEHRAPKIFKEKFLIHVAECSCLELVKIGLARFEQHHYEFGQDIQIAILNAAVKGARLTTVEYLVKEKGLLKIVKDFEQLLHSCFSLEQHYKDHNHHQLIIEQRVQIMRMFFSLNNRKFMEACNTGARSPLLAKYADIQLRIELIKLGANVHVQDDFYGLTVLHQDYSNEESEKFYILLTHIPDGSLRQLFQLKDKWSRTPLMSIVKYFDPTPETLGLFRKLGADFNSVKEKGYSVLAKAVKEGRNENTVRNLIKYGSNIQWKGSNGDTLLHVASREGNFGVLEFLIKECGLGVNTLNKEGLNSLTNAIKYYDTYGPGKLFETGIILQRYSARLNAKCGSLIHNAVIKRHFQAARLLLHLGVNVNSKDELGNSPLHYAVKSKTALKSDCLAYVKLLIDNNADPYSMNDSGETPYHIVLKDIKKNDIAIQDLESKNLLNLLNICDTQLKNNKINAEIIQLFES